MVWGEDGLLYCSHQDVTRETSNLQKKLITPKQTTQYREGGRDGRRQLEREGWREAAREGGWREGGRDGGKERERECTVSRFLQISKENKTSNKGK